MSIYNIYTGAAHEAAAPSEYKRTAGVEYLAAASRRGMKDRNSGLHNFMQTLPFRVSGEVAPETPASATVLAGVYNFA